MNFKSSLLAVLFILPLSLVTAAERPLMEPRAIHYPTLLEMDGYDAPEILPGSESGQDGMDHGDTNLMPMGDDAMPADAFLGNEGDQEDPGNLPDPMREGMLEAKINNRIIWVNANYKKTTKFLHSLANDKSRKQIMDLRHQMEVVFKRDMGARTADNQEIWDILNTKITHFQKMADDVDTQFVLAEGAATDIQVIFQAMAPKLVDAKNHLKALRLDAADQFLAEFKSIYDQQYMPKRFELIQADATADQKVEEAYDYLTDRELKFFFGDLLP